MRHEPQTMADALVLQEQSNGAQLPSGDGIDDGPLPITEMLTCLPTAPCGVPTCTRVVATCHLAYVGNCPVDAFGGAEYACDGCRSTAILTGAITPEAFVYYTGGTVEAIDRAAARTVREREDGNLPGTATVDLPADYLLNVGNLLGPTL
jgi:hypothetical protein